MSTLSDGKVHCYVCPFQEVCDATKFKESVKGSEFILTVSDSSICPLFQGLFKK